MTELERLSRTLVEAYTERTPLTVPYDLDPNGQLIAKHCVRAILLAMREPTAAQYDALCATGKMWGELDSKTVWQTYIDSILAGDAP